MFLHLKIMFVLSPKKLRPIMYSASATICYSVVQSQFQGLNWGRKLWLVSRWWWETSVVQPTVQDYIHFMIVIYAATSDRSSCRKCSCVECETVDKYRNPVIKCNIIPLSEPFMAFPVHYKTQYHRYFQPAFLLRFFIFHLAWQFQNSSCLLSFSSHWRY
jgi:hypothetical protein